MSRVIQSLLIDHHGLIALLEQRVQSVEDGRVANVCVLENSPLSLANRLYKD